MFTTGQHDRPSLERMAEMARNHEGDRAQFLLNPYPGSEVEFWHLARPHLNSPSQGRLGEVLTGKHSSSFQLRHGLEGSSRNPVSLMRKANSLVAPSKNRGSGSLSLEKRGRSNVY